jgi:predicted 2-oxoglutarate/Fe(II)-dependent dioxygenase YbiX
MKSVNTRTSRLAKIFWMHSMSKKLCEIKLGYMIVNFDNKFKLTISKLNKQLKTYPTLKKTRNLFHKLIRK